MMRSKQSRSKNLSMALLKERMAGTKDKTDESQKLNINKFHPSIADKAVDEHKHVVKLSPYEYKRHRRAKDIFVKVIGKTSDDLHNNRITKEDFARLQVEGAKLAIRTYNLAVAVRAWDEVFPQLLEIPGRVSKGVPILFQPMADYMVQWSKIHKPMIVDEGLFFNSKALESGSAELKVE